MISFLQGDVFDNIKKLEDNSIDCVVTSPPYWGLRDYGVSGQLGLEPTYQEHIQNIVELFRAIKPKLKDSATIWLNYGDSYAATVNGTKVKDQIKNKVQFAGKYLIDGDDRTFRDKPFSTIQGSLKPKDLVMIPNRIAIALQDDGWWIRSEIIWHKPNPMPESVRDRPTSAHEKIWLITKSKKYYYDANAIREPLTSSSIKRLNQDIKNQKGSTRANGGMKSNGNMKAICNIEGKNKRNVWTVTTKPFKDAHFATFPKDLIEPCIKAGCPEKVCVECGTPYKKNYKRQRIRRDELDPADPRYRPNKYKGGYEEINGKGDAGYQSSEFIGFEKDCNCETDKFEGGVVLDPFGGSGTTGIVAQSLNRQAILIELNKNYINIAKKRINKELGMFSGS